MWYFYTKITPRDPGGWGQFGDSFGTVNALFSGLALAGVLVSLFYQRNDLKLQLDEFKKSLEAQQDSARAQGLIATINAKSAILSSFVQQYALYENTNVQRKAIDKTFASIRSTSDIKQAIEKLEDELEELAAKLQKEVTSDSSSKAFTRDVGA